jgi:multidrug resistance efflux pump
MAGVFKVSSLLTFMPDDAPWFIAAFRPNGLANIKEGYEAEVFFTVLPGKTFKARVKKVWDEIAEGQLLPNARMKSVSKVHDVPPGRIPVQIEILDDLSGYNIPKGSNFGVTVYSEHLTMLKELRSIYFGMFSWQNIMNFEEL